MDQSRQGEVWTFGQGVAHRGAAMGGQVGPQPRRQRRGRVARRFLGRLFILALVAGPLFAVARLQVRPGLAFVSVLLTVFGLRDKFILGRPSARPGVQAEGRLRGAPAGRPALAGRSWAEDDPKRAGGGAPSCGRGSGQTNSCGRAAAASSQNEACTGARAKRVAGGGVERPAAAQRRPPGVAPVGAAKAAAPSVTAGRSQLWVKPAAKA
jgi:hypothetical protein